MGVRVVPGKLPRGTRLGGYLTSAHAHGLRPGSTDLLDFPVFDATPPPVELFFFFFFNCCFADAKDIPRDTGARAGRGRQVKTEAA